MKIVIKNGIIVTLNKDNEIINMGQVEIDDNIITYVGKNRESDGQIIDANGNIIMPGFVNTHAHLAMSLFRGYAENCDFTNWWSDYMRPLEEKLEGNDCYFGAKLGALELIKNGVTTVADFYYHPEQTAKALNELGLRASIGIGAISGRDIISEEWLDDIVSKICLSRRLKPILYAHSLYSCDESQFSEINRYAIKNNLIKSTHVSETLQEVGDMTAKYNMTPIEMLESFGFFDSPCLLAHCVHCDKSDIEIMSRYDNISIATNPSSNLILGSGIAPLYSYVKSNINVSIGTDSAASNNNLNMFKEMYLADNLQAGVLNQARAITSVDTLKMATIRGAKALGYDNLGRIQENYIADIIIIDIRKPNMQPLNNIYSNLVNACQSDNVIFTMVDGKILYRDGKYCDEVGCEEIISKCNEIISRIENR